MKASEIRAEARQKLAGKWKNTVLLFLVFCIISFVISFVLNLIPIIGALINLVITVPLTFGILITLFKLYDNEETSFFGFFEDGFSNFGRAWCAKLWTFVKLIIPLIFVLISAVLFTVATINSNSIILAITTILYIASLVYLTAKQLSFSLVNFILIDNKELSAKEAVEKSAKLMKGHIWEYINLYFSFIGWLILSMFTFYIGLLWLFPYIQASQISFYRNLLNSSSEE